MPSVSAISFFLSEIYFSQIIFCLVGRGEKKPDLLLENCGMNKLVYADVPPHKQANVEKLDFALVLPKLRFF